MVVMAKPATAAAVPGGSGGQASNSYWQQQQQSLMVVVDKPATAIGKCLGFLLFHNKNKNNNKNKYIFFVLFSHYFTLIISYCKIYSISCEIHSKILNSHFTVISPYCKITVKFTVITCIISLQ